MLELFFEIRFFTTNVAFHIRTMYEILDMVGSNIPDTAGRKKNNNNNKKNTGNCEALYISRKRNNDKILVVSLEGALKVLNDTDSCKQKKTASV